MKRIEGTIYVECDLCWKKSLNKMLYGGKICLSCLWRRLPSTFSKKIIPLNLEDKFLIQLSSNNTIWGKTNVFCFSFLVKTKGGERLE
jgi:hypothetical protein